MSTHAVETHPHSHPLGVIFGLVMAAGGLLSHVITRDVVALVFTGVGLCLTAASVWQMKRSNDLKAAELELKRCSLPRTAPSSPPG